jgi:NAD(P)-dependent dehydrogenase (short-subunit alcohol dehydrogenase family)
MVIIANAALMSDWSAYDPIGDLAEDCKRLDQDLRDHFEVNVIGNIHLFTLFLPLILRGSAKKVVAISSGMADWDLIAKYDIDAAAPYSISKAALNVATAKFSAQYSEKGVLFLAISPGVIDTGALARASDEEKAKFMKMGTKFASYAPHFKGPVTPDVSVKQVLEVVEKASIDCGYAGAFISHLGTKQWI